IQRPHSYGTQHPYTHPRTLHDALPIFEFDLETLTPTYRLSIGLPGGSQAFAIAERLGLSGPIVEDARSRLTEAQQAFEETLARIDRKSTRVNSSHQIISYAVLCLKKKK